MQVPVSVSFCEPGLVETLSLLVVSLTTLALKILSPCLVQDSPSCTYCLAVGLYVFPSVVG